MKGFGFGCDMPADQLQRACLDVWERLKGRMRPSLAGVAGRASRYGRDVVVVRIWSRPAKIEDDDEQNAQSAAFCEARKV